MSDPFPRPLAGGGAAGDGETGPGPGPGPDACDRSGRARPRDASRRRSHTLRLVFVGAATLGASGCEREPVEPVLRPLYASAEACQEDWGSGDLCEPLAGGAAPAASAASQATGRTSHGAFFRGPYYSTRGHYYGYDGQVHRFARPPSRMVDVAAATLGERAIHATPGRYAATPLHSSAATRHASLAMRAAVSRGGFGRSGFSSSG